jgi:hypothetical protein
MGGKTNVETRMRHILNKMTPDKIAKFKRDWDRGIALKIVADDLDMEFEELRRLRPYLKLEPRRTAGNKSSFVRVYVRDEYILVAKKRARERGQSLSAYINALIKRDIGFS